MWRSWIAGCFIALLTACSPPPEPVRIGLNSWPGYEFLYLAEQLGYYRDAGVEVKLVTFSSLADSRRAFERGQLDVLGCTLVEMLLAREQPGVDPVLIYAADYSQGGDMLLARPEIKSIADLRGKRVALEAQTVDVLTASLALQRGGLTFNDVKLISMPQANAVKAFRNGELHALQTYPPFAQELLNEGIAHRLHDSSQEPGKIVDVLMATRSMTNERQEQLALVLRAFMRAQAFYQSNPKQAEALMAKREGLSAEDFHGAIGGLHMLYSADQPGYLVQGKLLDALGRTHSALQQVQPMKQSACTAACVDARAYLAGSTP